MSVEEEGIYRSGSGEHVVAIDGPSASGKSTVARRVAGALGWVYVDSGSAYRAMTWKILLAGIPVSEALSLVPLLDPDRWSMRVEQGAVFFSVDGVYPGNELRGPAVRESVSDVAARPEVRRFLVQRLRETLRFGPVVMEGRDIGTVVFPESRFKFYLDASSEERARRRLGEIVAREGRGDVAEVQASLSRRDAKDRTRKTAPLQIALNAAVIDSTNMEISAVVDLIVSRVRAGGERPGARP
jgi:CMP/dCMP kinase